MTASLAGKVALITGATSGIGEASARLMAARGASVIVSGLLQNDADRIAGEIVAGGGRAIGVAGDVAEEAAVRRIVDRGVDAFGGIDILFVDVWDHTMAVNLRGPMLCCKHAIPHMLARGSGSILMTSSGRGIQGDLDLPAYGVSKGGLVTLARYVATQYGKRNIRCNVLVLGLILTPATRATFTDEMAQLVMEHHMTPFLGMPEDVAEVAAFLSSDAARFVTGHAMVVDGGVTSHSSLYADMLRMAPGT